MRKGRFYCDLNAILNCGMAFAHSSAVGRATLIFFGGCMAQILLALLCVATISAFAQTVEVRTFTEVFVSQHLEGGVQMEKARCGFLATDSFMCKIPVAVTRNPLLGEPGSVHAELNVDDKSGDLIRYFLRSKVEFSGNYLNIYVHDDELVEHMFYKAFQPISRDEIKKKVDNLGRILVNSPELVQDADSFALNLQMSSFPQIFSQIQAQLKALIDQHAINITASWQPGFDAATSASMVSAYCATAEGRGNKQCQLIDGLKH
jgi:hypothetical protein